MTRKRRQESEACSNCISWTRGEPQRNADMTIRVEPDPVGTCNCGPPSVTVIPMPTDRPGKFALEGITQFPPTMKAGAWCGQYERDPNKPHLAIAPDPDPAV